MPDLFLYLLGGDKVTEYTIASTSQLLDVNKRDWAEKILELTGLRYSCFRKIVKPGLITGKLKKNIACSAKLKNTAIVTGAGHDTAAAAIAAPHVTDNSFMYISCGTWSLIGVEINEPIINDKCIKFGLNNQGSIEDKIRLQKGVNGLWILQELIRQWHEEGYEYKYNCMKDLFYRAEAFKCFIDIDSPIFIEPGNISSKIVQFCIDTKQKPPEAHEEFIRCIYESMVLKYRDISNKIESVVGKKYEKIYFYGGGSKDGLLPALTADATNKEVCIGFEDATSAGNILIQLIALNEIDGQKHARQVAFNSTDIKLYAPSGNEILWDIAFNRYCKLIETTDYDKIN
jgi:rhamnulokinase